MQGGATQAEEEAGDSLPGWDYAYSLQTWKSAGWADYFATEEEAATHARRTMMEEVFHMVTVAGYARAHPAQFGMDDFTSSVACREQQIGVQGAHLNPLGLFLNPLGIFLLTSIPFIWRNLSAFLRA